MLRGQGSHASVAECTLAPLFIRLFAGSTDRESVIACIVCRDGPVFTLVGVLLRCITAVFNNSLVSGVFPSVYKSALVKPHLKKMSLDPDDLTNYRLVSNLFFLSKVLSKVLERIVPSQLNEHFNHNNLLSPLQSAYRPNHSTETSLLMIVNDLLAAMDNNIICILTLLDLSAAFDTIDHQILLTRLQHSFGISGLGFRLIFVAERMQSP